MNKKTIIIMLKDLITWYGKLQCSKVNKIKRPHYQEPRIHLHLKLINKRTNNIVRFHDTIKILGERNWEHKHLGLGIHL